MYCRPTEFIDSACNLDLQYPLIILVWCNCSWNHCSSLTYLVMGYLLHFSSYCFHSFSTLLQTQFSTYMLNLLIAKNGNFPYMTIVVPLKWCTCYLFTVCCPLYEFFGNLKPGRVTYCSSVYGNWFTNEQWIKIFNVTVGVFFIREGSVFINPVSEVMLE